MLHDPIDMACVKSIISLAKDLKIKMIAEYVENAEILAAVNALGIEFAQGYHISYPSPEFHATGQFLDSQTR